MVAFRALYGNMANFFADVTAFAVLISYSTLMRRLSRLSTHELYLARVLLVGCAHLATRATTVAVAGVRAAMTAIATTVIVVEVAVVSPAIIGAPVGVAVATCSAAIYNRCHGIAFSSTSVASAATVRGRRKV
jgi:hypothetical protein